MRVGAKFEVSSKILRNFRQGITPPHPPPPQNESLKSPPRLELSVAYYI